MPRKISTQNWVKQHRKRQAVLTEWIERGIITEGLGEILDDLDNRLQRERIAFTKIEKSALALRQSAAGVRQSIESILIENTDQSPMIKLSLANRKIDKATRQQLAAYKGDFKGMIGELQYNLALGYGVAFTKKELAVLSALDSPALDQLKYESVMMKADVKALMLKNLGQGLSSYDIVKGLKKLYPSYERNIYTLTNTSLLNTYKDAQFTKLVQNFNYFKYLGPNDSVTRAYCQQHVGKIYTAEQAKEIQATILTFYNCRHTLEPVANKDAGINI